MSDLKYGFYALIAQLFVRIAPHISVFVFDFEPPNDQTQFIVSAIGFATFVIIYVILEVKDD